MKSVITPGHIAILALLGMATVSISACGSGSRSGVSAGSWSVAPPSDLRTATSTMALPTATEARPEARAQLVASWPVSLDNGYTVAAEIYEGRVQRASNNLSHAGDALGSACEVSPETDAVIPFALTLVNTTRQFSYAPSLDLAAQVPPGQSQVDNAFTVSGEVDYSNGAQCMGPPSEDAYEYELDGCTANETLSYGQSVTCGGFIVLSNYYSPAYPSGDRHGLMSVYINITTQANSDGEAPPIDGAPLIPPYTALPAGASGPFSVSDDNTHVFISPSPFAHQVGTLSSGDTVTVVCTTRGPSMLDDQGQKTTLWDKVSVPAGYVSDAYVNTGTASPTARQC